MTRNEFLKIAAEVKNSKNLSWEYLAEILQALPPLSELTPELDDAIDKTFHKKALAQYSNQITQGDVDKLNDLRHSRRLIR